MTIYAFTGHRPQDLPWDFGYASFAYDLTLYLDERQQDETNSTFITGGALGIDTRAAEYALRREIPLTLILPFTFDIMTSKWMGYHKETLSRHMDYAREVIVMNIKGYDVREYQRRNEEMVNRADHVLAYWSGKRYGGTANCIRYAQSIQKPITNLLPGGPRL